MSAASAEATPSKDTNAAANNKDTHDSLPSLTASASTKDSSSQSTFTTLSQSQSQKDSSHDVVGSADQTAAILTYLQKRGFTRAEAAFKAEIDAYVSGATPEQAAAAAVNIHGRPPTVSLDDLAAKNAPRDFSKESPDDNNNNNNNKDKDKSDETDASTAAAHALLLDPTDRARGFAMLKSWCEGSLDIYQHELLPILLPLFVHSFLDLVAMGYGSAATAFYSAHVSSFLPTHTALLSQIRSLALPSHIQSDPLAQRFRTERYVIKMSNTVFGLLLGWLTDGTGPAAGSSVALDEAQEPARRARDAMLKIVNERCRIQVLAAQPFQIDASVLEEGTGLTGAGPSFSSHPTGPANRSRHHPSLQKNAVSEADAVAEFNAKAAGPQLKLHPSIPLSERLQTEVDKELNELDKREKEETTALQQAQQAASAQAGQPSDASAAAGTQDGSTDAAAATAGSSDQPAPSQQDGDITMEDASTSTAKPGETTTTPGRERATSSVRPSEPPSSAAAALSAATGPDFSVGLLAPSITDLPPQAPTFRTVDVKREVQRVKDARKRIRLDPSLLNGATVPAPFASGVRDSASNALGEDGARAARVAALPSVCAYTYHDADDGVTCSAFSGDISLMAAGFEESFVQVWSLKGEKLRAIRGDPNLNAVRDSRSLRKQREAEAEAYSTRKLIGHSGPVYAVDFDPIGGSAAPPRNLLSCSADGTARLWSLDTYSALVAYRGHQHPVWDVKWSPLGTYFATASADRTARLWSTERINPLRMYAGHLSDVDCLSFHPNSLYLATGSSDRSCRLWDVQRGACVRLFVGHQSPVSCVRISPDGRYLASSSADAAISLWDLASGRRIKKMWGHTKTVHALDFSADGSILVSGSHDATVRTWDVRSAGGPKPATTATATAADSVAAATAAVGAGAAESESADALATFHTKRSPIVDVHFTPRNLCLVAAVYEGD